MKYQVHPLTSIYVFLLFGLFYRCDSVETAELLGGQLKALASHSDNLARIASTESRIRSNLGSDGRSTRESESSEGSGELRHVPVQASTIYESLAAELRAKLGILYCYSANFIRLFFMIIIIQFEGN